MKIKNYRAAIGGLIFSSVFAFGGIQSAAAQEVDANGEPDEIIVTGTQIRGIAPVGAPVVSISPEDITKSGAADITAALKTMPQISYLGLSESATGTSANGNAQNQMSGSGVNIRSLGQQATLVLINGRRGAPGGQFASYFEPANIPAIALGGIEILTDGASATYGSDAMAGVVNLILRRNYDGMEARGSYGFADGFDQHSISAVVGKTWNSGSFLIASERNYHSNLLAEDRPDLFIANAPSVYMSNGRLPRGYTNFTYLPNIRTGVGTVQNPYIFYAASASADSFSDLTPNAQNIAGNWYNSDALPEQARHSVVAAFDQQLTDQAQLYGQAFYSDRDFRENGQRVAAALAQNLTLPVPSGNPCFIAGVPGAAASQTVLLSLDQVLGRFGRVGYEKSWQMALGLKVDLWGDWRLDISGQNSSGRVKRSQDNVANTCGSTGGNAATCLAFAGEIPGVGTVGQTNPAFAFNPFGAQNAYVINRIDAANSYSNFYDSYTVNAKMDGTLFALAGGDVRAAIGYEYSEETAGGVNSTSSNAASASQSISIATEKSMKVHSIFGEVVIPIVGSENARGGIQSLDVSLAVRYTNYNILSESTTDPKLGITWRPTDDLRLSGSYGTSFRVNIRSTDQNNAPLNRIRSIQDYLAPSGSALGIQLGGGNPNLKPEESTTWTIGASWAPSSIPGLNLDLTFFNVHYKDIIDTPGAAVFGSISASAEEIYQAYITRRPSTVTQGADDTAFNALVAYYLAQPSFTGQALSPVNLIIDARSNNAGVIKTDGLDFRLGYEFGAGNSKFNAGISGSYFFNYDRSLTADAPLISRIDLIDFPQKYRLRGELGWQNERGFSAFAFGNFTPSYQNTYAVPIASVDSYLTVDAMLAYDTGESGARSGLNNVQLSLNAQNLFDTPPPFVAAFSQNFDSAITSMLQRVISLSIAKKF